MGRLGFLPSLHSLLWELASGKMRENSGQPPKGAPFASPKAERDLLFISWKRLHTAHSVSHLSKPTRAQRQPSSIIHKFLSAEKFFRVEKGRKGKKKKNKLKGNL